MSEVDRVRLSQLISHALRHHPDRFGIELSEFGWASLEKLAVGLSANVGYEITVELLIDVILVEGGTRYEMDDDLVRATYGHTQPVTIEREASVPPELLYHGTLTEYLDSIRLQGLLRRNLHHVHLSSSPVLASEMGGRRGEHSVVTVDAQAAYEAGLEFFQVSDEIWLVKEVPPQYLM